MNIKTYLIYFFYKINLSIMPVVDVTKHFEGSVGKAQNYFKNPNNNYQYVYVYSERKRQYYHNNDEIRPSRFTVFSEMRQLNYKKIKTNKFDNVTDARNFFKNKQNKYECVCVYSKRMKSYYFNPFRESPSRFVKDHYANYYYSTYVSLDFD